jgi:hypothetical protein
MGVTHEDPELLKGSLSASEHISLKLLLTASKKPVQSLPFLTLSFPKYRLHDLPKRASISLLAWRLGSILLLPVTATLPCLPHGQKFFTTLTSCLLLAGRAAAAASHADGCGCWEGRRQSARAGRAARGSPRRGALPEEEESSAVQRQAALHEVSLSKCSGLCEATAWLPVDSSFSTLWILLIRMAFLPQFRAFETIQSACRVDRMRVHLKIEACFV